MQDMKVYVRREHPFRLRDLLIITLLSAVPFLFILGRFPLMDPDEGRYAEIAREMLERNDFVTPTLNYVKYFEKPPLLYWLNAASIKLFGQNEFAARLPSAMSGLATILASSIIAVRLFDRRTALFSALFLATTAGFVIQSRIILTDMLLTFCLTAALGSFIIGARREEWYRGGSYAWYLFYFFCALAVLAKGLIGILFPSGIIFFYLLITREWRILKKMCLPCGLLIFFAVAAPWFVVVSLKNPEFANFFFIHEHFKRFTSTVHGRYQPFWYFVPVLLGTMLPWSFFIPDAIGSAWRNRDKETGKAGLFLVIWAVFIFLFFSKSGSKLIPYMLPIFPPLMILIANRFSGIIEECGREIKLASIFLGSALTILGFAMFSYHWLPEAAAAISGIMPRFAAPLKQFVKYSPSITLSAILPISSLFLLQGVVLLGSAGRYPARIATVLCLCSFLLEITLIYLLMGGIAESESPRDLARKINSITTPDARIVTFGPMQAVSWYTGRRVMVTENPDELEFGSRQGDNRVWFPDRQMLMKLWGEKTPMFIILKKREYEGVAPLLNPPARCVQESGRLILITNR